MSSLERRDNGFSSLFGQSDDEFSSLFGQSDDEFSSLFGQSDDEFEGGPSDDEFDRELFSWDVECLCEEVLFRDFFEKMFGRFPTETELKAFMDFVEETFTMSIDGRLLMFTCDVSGEVFGTDEAIIELRAIRATSLRFAHRRVAHRRFAKNSILSRSAERQREQNSIAQLKKTRNLWKKRSRNEDL